MPGMQSCAVGGIVYGPAPGSSGCGQSDGAQVSQHVALAAQTFGMLECLQYAFAQVARAVPGQMTQHMRRNDGADRVAEVSVPQKGKNSFAHRISWVFLCLPGEQTASLI